MKPAKTEKPVKSETTTKIKVAKTAIDGSSAKSTTSPKPAKPAKQQENQKDKVNSCGEYCACVCQSAVVQENRIMKNALLATSLIINLILFIVFVCVMVVPEYAHQVGNYIYNL